MDFVIEEGTLAWAEKRVQQLREAEISIGCAVEQLKSIPADLKDGACLMPEQPESDVMQSFATDLEKLTNDLTQRFNVMVKDRKRIQTAIWKYEEEHHDRNT